MLRPFLASLLLHLLLLCLFPIFTVSDSERSFSVSLGVIRIPVSVRGGVRASKSTLKRPPRKRGEGRERILQKDGSAATSQRSEEGRGTRMEAGVSGRESEIQAEIHPIYPRISRKLGEEGEVRVQLVFGSEGRLLDVKLLKSSGSARLDESALTAVRQGVFRMSTPLEAGLVKNVSIVFKLSEG